MTNLNEDPILNHKIQFSLEQPTTVVGKKTADPLPDIVLGSMGINENHAVFKLVDNKLLLAPCEVSSVES